MHVFLPFNLTRDQPMSFFRIVRHAHWTLGSMHLQWLFETNAPSLLRLIESTGATVIVPIGVDLSMVEARLLDHEADGPAKIAAWRDHLLNSGDPQTQPMREQLYWTLSHVDVPNWHPSVNGSERDVDLVLERVPGWWKEPARELHEKNVWRWLTGADKEHIARELDAAVDKSRLAEPRWWDMVHDVNGDGSVMLATMDQACAVTAKAKGWTAAPSFPREARRLDFYLDATQPDGIDVVAAWLNDPEVPAELRWWDMEHDDSPTAPFMFATMDQACAVTGKAPGWTAVPWTQDASLAPGSPYLDATVPGAIDVVAAHLNALVVPPKPQARRITLRGALNVANLVKNSEGLPITYGIIKVMGHEVVNFHDDDIGYALPDQVITLDVDGHAQVEVYTGPFVMGTTPRTFTFLNVTPI